LICLSADMVRIQPSEPLSEIPLETGGEVRWLEREWALFNVTSAPATGAPVPSRTIPSSWKNAFSCSIVAGTVFALTFVQQ